MKKGFTLIELLGVIVILAFISVICMPLITGIVEDSKRESFLRSTEGIIKAIEFDITEKEEDMNYTYIIKNGNISNLTSNINVSNISQINGTIKYNKDSVISYALNNGYWCAYKQANKELVVNNDIDGCTFPPEPNHPVLDDNMLAIKYVDNKPYIVDSSEDNKEDWYNYSKEERKWANAVVLINNPSKEYTIGDELLEDDVMAYFVWIPRYEYTLKNTYGVNGTSKTSPGYIDIRFSETSTNNYAGSASYTEDEPDNWRTQEAFKYDNKDLAGIWVGKFETTGSADNPTIKPSSSPLRNQYVSVQFETAKKVGINASLELETNM